MSLEKARQVFTDFPHPIDWNEQIETYRARAMCDFWTRMCEALGIGHTSNKSGSK